MPKPTIVDRETILNNGNIQPLADLVWDVFAHPVDDRPVSTVEEARDKLEVVAREGDTMTGPLVLPSTDPTQDDHAVRKAYVDLLDNQRVEKAGDTMTGPLVLPSDDPTLDDHAARKAYVDRRATEEAEAAIAFPFSASMPGYIRLPGGILIQFGSATTVVGGGAITFPQPFTSANTYVAFGSYYGGTAVFATFNHVSGTSMQGHLRDLNGNSIATSGGLRWCAIGY